MHGQTDLKFLPSSTLCNTSLFLTRSVQLIFPILLQHHTSKLSQLFLICSLKCVVNWLIRTQIQCAVVQFLISWDTTSFSAAVLDLVTSLGVADPGDWVSAPCHRVLYPTRQQGPRSTRPGSWTTSRNSSARCCVSDSWHCRCVAHRFDLPYECRTGHPARTLLLFLLLVVVVVVVVVTVAAVVVVIVVVVVEVIVIVVKVVVIV